jgi:hypothetical protein
MKHAAVYTNDSPKKILQKSNFFLDTLFSCFYTFVNCDNLVAVQKGRIENYGNEKGSQETGQESSKEGREEEVSNR